MRIVKNPFKKLVSPIFFFTLEKYLVKSRKKKYNFTDVYIYSVFDF